jgi:hypothetical protein
LFKGDGRDNSDEFDIQYVICRYWFFLGVRFWTRGVLVGPKIISLDVRYDFTFMFEVVVGLLAKATNWFIQATSDCVSIYIIPDEHNHRQALQAPLSSRGANSERYAQVATHVRNA